MRTLFQRLLRGLSRRLPAFVTFLLLAGLPLFGQPAPPHPQALLYLTEDPAGIQSFIAHANKIDIVVPNWYSVDAAGLVWGGPNPLVLETARRERVRVMPIVVNPNFDQDMFHKFASTPEARMHFISALVAECKKYGYIGFQFDFENVSWTDAQTLTGLVTETALAFHRQGLQLSIATVPNAPGYPGRSGFAKWMYENWRGAYDLKSLAEQVDLICLMTYDEHTRYTPPGPVAGYQWTVENLDYALQFVPREKLSLGIPLYGYRWYAGEPGKDNRPALTAVSIRGEDVQQLIRTYHPVVQWDDADRSSWFFFYRDSTREWVFYTDARTFNERLALVSARGLQGFCSWVLGNEDPGIWERLPARR